MTAPAQPRTRPQPGTDHVTVNDLTASEPESGTFDLPAQVNDCEEAEPTVAATETTLQAATIAPLAGVEPLPEPIEERQDAAEAMRAGEPQQTEASPAAGKRRAGTAKLVLLLGSMSALGALTTDMYLPSLPDVATELGTGVSAVQFTITGTMIGGALGQLVIGPLSDRFGRRAPVFAGLLLHVLASLACLFAFNVAPLVVLRVLQGVGNAAAGVVAMAVIRDRLTGAEASAVLSRLMLVIGVAPLFAPTIGSAVAGLWGWRAVFLVLAAYGAILFGVVWRFLPESLPVHRRIRSLRGVVGTYGALLRDRQFLAFAILPGLGNAALFSYVAGSPFVLREGYGLTETQFSLLFAVNGAGLVIGAQINAYLVRRFSPIRIMRLALPLATLCATVLFAVGVSGVGGLVVLLVPLFFMLMINSMMPPNASAVALSRHGERAGGAAAFIGASQAGIGGVVAPLVGALGGGTLAMTTVILGAMLTALAIFALGTPAYRRDALGAQALAVA